MDKDINIGIVIASKIGSNTAILLDEFKFIDNFRDENPDVNFYIITVHPKYTKDYYKSAHLLQHDYDVIEVHNESDFHKVDNFSGLFIYQPSNNFFAGRINPNHVLAYLLASYITINLRIPLFVRVADSEYPYFDHKKLIENRLAGKTDSVRTFRENNTPFGLQKILDVDYIDYDLVYWVSNGSDLIYDWVPDVIYHEIPENVRVPELRHGENALYVSDALLFNYNKNRERFQQIKDDIKHKDDLIYIGYMKGSVNGKRQRILKDLIASDDTKIDISVIGPGANEIRKIKEIPGVTIQNGTIKGDDFFKTLNSHIGYVFIGKGNSVNKYINKTIYDCVACETPIIIYDKCDTTKVIFEDDMFRISNKAELIELCEKLRDPVYRENYVTMQRDIIKYKLSNKFRPLFKFNDFCERRNPITTEKVPTLF